MSPKRRGHGEGSIFRRHTPECPPPGPDGERPQHTCAGRWVGTVDLGLVGGKRVRKTVYGRTRKEVSIKVEQANVAKRGGHIVIGTVTVEKWMRRWLEVHCVERELKVTTIRSYRSKVENYIVPNLGPIPLDRLTVDHIRAMYAEMTKAELSPATRAATHAVLRKALSDAVREHKAAYNAADAMDPPKRAKTKREGLTLAEARRVLDAAGEDPRWWLALLLGLRQGEVLALRWCDVDFVNGVLHIERSLATDNDGAPVFHDPKTVKSKAAMPLLTPVASRLMLLHARTQGAPDDLVFSRTGGRPLSDRRDREAWADLLASVDVAHVPLHAARNTTASLLKSLGVPLDDAQEILRHSTAAMTDHYQAEDVERKRRVLGALEAALTDEPERDA